MKEKLLAIWRLATALLLYPAALIALIYISSSGRSWLWGTLVIALILFLDRTWLALLSRIIKDPQNK